MRHLAEQLGVTVHLAILDEMDVVYIEKVDAVQSLRMYSQIGKRIPAYCSALGKVLLSGLPRNMQKDILGRIEIKEFTPTPLRTWMSCSTD
jgi:DNA-binding IclR family transcriptional regulator